VAIHFLTAPQLVTRRGNTARPLSLQALEKLQAKMSREGMERLLMERQVGRLTTTACRVGLRVRLLFVTFVS
jgi:hypothetical protein